MATVSKGRTFVSGETVTPAKLNELVDNATVTAIQTADIADGQITNAKVSASAAIDLSKLATGALPTAITVASANIVDGTIVNADINASAAIAGSKLADAGITAAKLDGAQTGSAPIYGCRAWVNFNGRRNATDTGASTNGANVLVRASGNVSSVLKNGTGDYTITFTTAMPDANYSVVFGGHGNTTSSNHGYLTGHPSAQDGYTPAAGSIRVRGCNGANGAFDLECGTVAVFR